MNIQDVRAAALDAADDLQLERAAVLALIYVGDALREIDADAALRLIGVELGGIGAAIQDHD